MVSYFDIHECMFPQFRSLVYDGAIPCSFVGIYAVGHLPPHIPCRRPRQGSSMPLCLCEEPFSRRHDTVHVFPCTCLAWSFCREKWTRQFSVHHRSSTVSDVASLHKRNRARRAFTPHTRSPGCLLAVRNVPFNCCAYRRMRASGYFHTGNAKPHACRAAGDTWTIPSFMQGSHNL